VSVFTEAELAYLTGGRRLGRVATVGADGVVPVGWRYDADDDVIVVGGHELDRTKKFRNARRSGRAALVMGDFENITPWRPRGVEVRGRAEAVGGERPLIRIRPDRVVSWGLDRQGVRAAA
jgi:pyridoxamine 5'-phosphate oxidase family protein